MTENIQTGAPERQGVVMLEIIESLISDGALFVINHSGGKDSQVMYLELNKIIPDNQILIIHADLPEADWPNTCEHIQSTIHGHELKIVRAGKTFFDMVKHRQMWPSPKHRQCTSDLKRAPIEKAIRHYMKAHGFSKIVNCMGIRAEESASRAKAKVFKFNERNSKAGREWYDWLPIHEWLVDQIFYRIKQANQEPHWAYAKGMTRLSCCFCIMASKQDLKTASKLQPDLFKKYATMEKEINHTFVMPSKKNGKQFLTDIL